MAMVEGIQRRSPFSHSSLPSSTYDKYIDSDEFVVEKYPADQIRVFFRRAAAHSEGVGFSFLPLESPCHWLEFC
jgi:hypothetical protein